MFKKLCFIFNNYSHLSWKINSVIVLKREISYTYAHLSIFGVTVAFSDFYLYFFVGKFLQHVRSMSKTFCRFCHLI